MNLNFFRNFIIVLALLGLTVFSLVSFNDKTINSETSPDNYYFFDQVISAGRRVVRFLEDPKSIFVKNSDDNSGSAKNNSSSADYVTAYGDLDPKDMASSDQATTTKNDSNQAGSASSTKTIPTNLINSVDDNKFSLAKEAKSLQEATDNLKDANWRNQELPIRISNTLRHYTESSTSLLESKGLTYIKTATGHQLSWRTKAGKVYTINLP